MSAVENGADRIRCLPANIRDKAPDPEPSPPDGGFTTPVSYPFVAPGAKERVIIVGRPVQVMTWKSSGEVTMMS